MDEVGRGTTVQDGLAIAFATVYHLYRLNRSRVLFATHFHELADMLGYAEQGLKTGPFSGVDFFRTDVHITVVCCVCISRCLAIDRFLGRLYHVFAPFETRRQSGQSWT